ncbi:hypothetical protein [Streptomyces tremellae]|uniref:Uncharacterized protein n=1 Tax=Streptomyces tremellae TaxID=1124239 RepID=A0ABP7EFS6_9ACTN
MNGPEHYREAERLLVLADYHDDPDRRAAAQVHATLALAAATVASAASSGPLTVYRAEHESIPFGLYLTEAAAREHCEQRLSDEHPATTALIFDWLGDEDDPEEPHEPHELVVVQVDAGDETATGYVVTGYVVTPLEVAPEYDPEAEA